MKFKKGDKVVHVGSNWHYGKDELLTITGYYISTYGNHCYWTKENPNEPVLEGEIESLDLFNSPLYEALK